MFAVLFWKGSEIVALMLNRGWGKRLAKKAVNMDVTEEKKNKQKIANKKLKEILSGGGLEW